MTGEKPWLISPSISDVANATDAVLIKAGSGPCAVLTKHRCTRKAAL